MAGDPRPSVDVVWLLERHDGIRALVGSLSNGSSTPAEARDHLQALLLWDEATTSAHYVREGDPPHRATMLTYIDEVEASLP